MAEKIMKHLSYRTILQETEHCITIEKSKFLATISSCQTEQQAFQFIEQQKKKYWDASHHVYAYQLESNNMVRCSDDGEPTGTAGRPVLSILKKQQLQDVCLVVTRYFGGKRLGTGGLMRAYQQVTSQLIQSCHIDQKDWCVQIRLSFEYAFYGKIKQELCNYSVKINQSIFESQITLLFSIRFKDALALQKTLYKYSNKEYALVILGEGYIILDSSNANVR